MGSRIEPIRLQPAFSRYLTFWLTTLHLLGLLVLWQLQLHLLFKVSISLFLLSYLIWQVRHHLLRNTRSAIREVLLDADGSWWLIVNNGAKIEGKLLPKSFVKPWLVVLNFRTGPLFSARSVVLPPDSLDPDLARRLRIHLLQTGTAERRGSVS
ncbi:MAG: protein YgfX [Pseudomonadota bacterium]